MSQTEEILLPLSLQHGLRNGHAFDVFALHGVVPRFAIRQHPDSARNAFTMIFTSSEGVPGTLAALFLQLSVGPVRTCALTLFG